jgi:hypothetical protein
MEMPLYQGTKRLKARFMSKAEYCGLRGWRTPDDEDPNEIGYLVEYQDGGKPNVDGYEGYVSWSPADVFEKAYRPCGTFLDRLHIERTELSERISDLWRFINEKPQFAELDPYQQSLLIVQLKAMETYQRVLSARMDLLSKGD